MLGCQSTPKRWLQSESDRARSSLRVGAGRRADVVALEAVPAQAGQDLPVLHHLDDVLGVDAERLGDEVARLHLLPQALVDRGAVVRRADRGARVVLVEHHAGRQDHVVVVELLARQVDAGQHLVLPAEPGEGVGVVGLQVGRVQVLHLVVGAAVERRRVVDGLLARRDRRAVGIAHHAGVVGGAHAEADRRGALVAVVAAAAQHRVPLAAVLEAVRVVQRAVGGVAGAVVAGGAVVVLRIHLQQPARVGFADRPRGVLAQPGQAVVDAVAVVQEEVADLRTRRRCRCPSGRSARCRPCRSKLP